MSIPQVLISKDNLILKTKDYATVYIVLLNCYYYIITCMLHELCWYKDLSDMMIIKIIKKKRKEIKSKINKTILQNLFVCL